jgi:hypothetical protein
MHGGTSLGTTRALAWSMRFNIRPTFRRPRVTAMLALIAAVSGCSKAAPRQDDQPVALVTIDASARDTSQAGRAATAPDASKRSLDASPANPSADTTCPAVPPGAGPCRGNLQCTYHRDGPCGPDPDVFMVCFDGQWLRETPAIACRPFPDVEDAGASD